MIRKDDFEKSTKSIFMIRRGCQDDVGMTMMTMMTMMTLITMITIIIIMQMLKMITNVITNLGSRAYWRPASTSASFNQFYSNQKIFFNEKHFHENPYKFKSTAKLFIQTRKTHSVAKKFYAIANNLFSSNWFQLNINFIP